MRRICLIGLPRCGSQYISSLIMLNSPTGIKNLAEPFTPGHVLSLNDIGISSKDFSSYEEQVSLVIKNIQSLDSNQSLVMKLFLHSRIPLKEHARVVQVLEELNFKFIVVKRKNILDQLLSLGIGLKLNRFTNFNNYDNSILELDSSILSDMKRLQDDLANFDNVINELKLNVSSTMFYETIQEDLSTFLGRNINSNTRYKKMSSIPSVERISNIKEVLTFLNIS